MATLTNERVRSVVFSGTHPQLVVLHTTLNARDKHVQGIVVYQDEKLIYVKISVSACLVLGQMFYVSLHVHTVNLNTLLFYALLAVAFLIKHISMQSLLPSVFPQQNQLIRPLLTTHIILM